MTRLMALRVENYKRVELVEVEFDAAGGIVGLMGDNEAGKTSVLDALATLIAGPKMPKAEKPIRAGADQAKIIGRFDDIIITRVFKANGSTQIKITATDGVPARDPKEILDRLYSHIGLDPLAFSRLNDKAQVDQLLGLIGFDPAEIDTEHARRFAQRTIEKRDRDSIRAQLGALPDPRFDLPAEEQSAGKLAEQVIAAKSAHDRWARLQAELELAGQQAIRAEAAAEEANREWKRLEVQIRNTPPLPDVAPLEEALAQVEDVNKAVRIEQERRRLTEAAKGADDTVSASDERLKAIADEKRERLAAANIPVEGLTIVDGRLEIDGIPFADMSTAVKIRTGTAIAMALNPDLKLITIRDASLLDKGNREVIDELAREHGFTILAEYADTSAPVGVVLEDGHVAEVRK